MPDRFIPLAERFWVAPQITAEDVAAAKAMGVTLILNNRPDGEEPGQPTGAEIAAAAEAAGVAYAEVPVDRTGLTPAHLDAFDEHVGRAEGGVLAYCRSGARSTTLRAYARARAGADPDALVEEAAKAGYDLAPHKPALAGVAKG